MTGVHVCFVTCDIEMENNTHALPESSKTKCSQHFRHTHCKHFHFTCS